MRFATKLLLFALLTLLVGAALEQHLRATHRDFIAKKYEQVFGAPGPFNAVILGSSVQAHGIDPWLLNGTHLRWYNFAYNGGGPHFLRAWYTLYRRHAPAPAVALVPADWYVLTPGLQRRLEHDAGYLPWPDFAAQLLAPGTDRTLLLGNALATLSTRQDLQEGFALVHLPPDFAPDPNQFHDGYVPVSCPRPPDLGPNYPGSELDRFALEDYRLLLAHLRGDGVRVVLVRMPVRQPVSGRHDAEADKIVRMAGAAGLPLLSYTGPKMEGFCRAAENFADWQHLNERGSQRFSALLSHDLHALGVYR